MVRGQDGAAPPDDDSIGGNAIALASTALATGSCSFRTKQSVEEKSSIPSFAKPCPSVGGNRAAPGLELELICAGYNSKQQTVHESAKRGNNTETVAEIGSDSCSGTQ
uniref:Uncharacterized protein n=1 Tax=Anopheles maculatus TaxID=74869 RepID=A0A182SQN8_9DIPT